MSVKTVITTLTLSALVSALLVGCTAPIEPGHQAARDVLDEVVAMQIESPTVSDDFRYKTPAGVALYTHGYDIADDGEDPRASFYVIVVNLADGAVFVQRGGVSDTDGVLQFESVDSYSQWQGSAAGALPTINGVPGAYGRQVVTAQELHYGEFARFASRDELIEYSTDPGNLAPDLTPVAGCELAVEADAHGYIAISRSDTGPGIGVTFGYSLFSQDGNVGTVLLDDLGELRNEFWTDLAPPGVDGNPGRALDFVAVDPASLDAGGRVAAVPFPKFA
jgi:hypothetical protein